MTKGDPDETRGRKPARGEAGTPVTIRLTPTEREQYIEAAREADKSLAEWIRYCCDLVLRRKRK